MKILLLSDDMVIGGVARHIADIANALSEEGHSISVAATDGEAKHWLNNGIEFIPLSLKDNTRLTNNISGFIPSYIKLRKVLQQNRFDIVHSHKRYSHLLGKVLSKQFKIPFITSYHTVFSSKKYLSFFGDRTICCSNAVKESLLEQFGRNNEELITVYNGVHPFREYSQLEKENIRKELDISKDRQVIGSIGQFVPEKDRETLLFALADIRKRNAAINILVVLLGFGPQRNELEKCSRSLEVDGLVKFVEPNLSTEKLCNISSFMVLNSVVEGFPLVVLEAASVAKMHIATSIGGIPEFVENHKTGILVLPKDPIALSNAIQHAIDNPEMSELLGRNAKEKYLQSFSFEKMLNGIMVVYRNILKG